jgi:hypothetical protein
VQRVPYQHRTGPALGCADLRTATPDPLERSAGLERSARARWGKGMEETNPNERLLPSATGVGVGPVVS